METQCPICVALQTGELPRRLGLSQMCAAHRDPPDNLNPPRAAREPAVPLETSGLKLTVRRRGARPLPQLEMPLTGGMEEP